MALIAEDSDDHSGAVMNNHQNAQIQERQQTNIQLADRNNDVPQELRKEAVKSSPSSETQSKSSPSSHESHSASTQTPPTNNLLAPSLFSASLSSASSSDVSVNGDDSEKDSAATTRSLKSEGSNTSDDKPPEMKFIPTSLSSLLTSGSKSTEQLELEIIALDQPAAVFSELFQLSSSQVNNNVSLEWKEIARWVKYEESVEENGTRWSKPFVSTVPLSSFDSLKSSLSNGIFILDSPAISLEDVVDEIISLLRIRSNPEESVTQRIVEDFRREKRHQFQQKRSILSSINDLRASANKELSNGNVKVEDINGRASERTLPPLRINSLLNESVNNDNKSAGKRTEIVTNTNSNGSNPAIQLNGTASETTTVELTPSGDVQLSAGELNSREFTKNSFSASNLPKLQLPKSDSVGSFKPNKAFRKKIPTNSVGNSIFTAEVDYIQTPISAFVRLLNATDLGDLTEVSLPTKFIFIHLSPKRPEVGKHKHHRKNDSSGGEAIANQTGKDEKNVTKDQEDPVNIGRAFGTVMADTVFCDVALKGRSLDAFLGGIDVFLKQAGVLPPNLWDVSTRLEPPERSPPPSHHVTRRINSQALLSSDNTSNGFLSSNATGDEGDKWNDDRKRQEKKKKKEREIAEAEKRVELDVELDSEEEEEIERQKMGLTRSGRLFGGLINDVKRRLPHYKSDFTDGFAVQSVASIIFLYFACLTPIITFGGLLADATGNNIATMESLVCGALCGIVYGLFSGQPLTILGSTGPVLVFETIVYDFCSSNGFNYLSFRFWIGMWTAGILLLLVAFDASYLVCYITRFTEENFASLISVIFIVKAIEKLYEIFTNYPVAPTEMDCYCLLPNTQNMTASLKYNEQIFNSCYQVGGSEALSGNGCGTRLPSQPEYKPDIFFFSVILFLFTFIISVKLKAFRNSTYLGAKARELISDFAVPIAISSMTLMDIWWGIGTPKLQVPDTFKPTSASRGWLVIPFAEENPGWLIPFALLPALLATILIFMDQQISAVIVNRKENLLKKGCGYHLDLFVLCILITICSVFGLPWFVAATVLSITHVNSLTMFSESAAPGDKPKFLGVREQRLTHIIIFIFCGLSIFFTPILQRIPMPVLYGVFLYMGISSLHNSQFLNRILIFFMPAKYQPDYIFLRRIPIHRIHLFTLIQLICFIFLYTVKSYKPISITFPLMLLVILTVRKLLDYVFTRQELKILDDTMPESKRKKKEKLRNRAQRANDKLNNVIVLKAELLNDTKNA